MKRLEPLLVTVQQAPMDESYKRDVSLLVTESLIRAIEARTLHDGKAPEAQRREFVQASVEEGFILTQHFYEQLVQFEKTPDSLRNVYGDFLFTIDVEPGKEAGAGGELPPPGRPGGGPRREGETRRSAGSGGRPPGLRGLERGAATGGCGAGQSPAGPRAGAVHSGSGRDAGPRHAGRAHLLRTHPGGRPRTQDGRVVAYLPGEDPGFAGEPGGGPETLSCGAGRRRRQAGH